MTKQNIPLHLTGSLARTLLGLTFIFSGFVKAVDPLGTTYKIGDYLGAFGAKLDFFNSLLPLAEPAAIALIAFELVLGICLTCNVWTKVTSWLALAMMIVMTPITLYLALTNPIHDCGCFGDALVLSNWATFWKNVVLLVLVVILLLTKKYIPETFVWWVNLIILLLSLGFAGGFMAYNLLHLPVIDFRPYKVGVNVLEEMEKGEELAAANPDEYEITFIYEKDGQQQEFTLENYPKNDSTWTFVDQKSVLVKEGFVPAIHDLAFITADDDMEDLTYDILDSEDEVLLAIMYDLEKTNLQQAIRLNELYEQAQWDGKAFYAITGSGEEQISEFRFHTGAEYPFCTCDPITLKTIVRANPGIVVVQGGVIVDKYNLRNR